MSCAVKKTSRLSLDPALFSSETQELLHSLSNVYGLDYFQKLSSILCIVMDVEIALVGRVVDEGTRIQTLALYWDGEQRPSFTYELDNTPCQETVSNDYCLYRTDVQQAFPQDQILIEEAIEGYIGYPLLDEKGVAIGTIVGLSRKPISTETDVFDFIEIVAARTRAELLHYIAEEKLKETLSQALILNYSKTMFMANISHELRTPLGAMIGYASLIRDKQVDSRNIQDYAVEIGKTGEELLTLIDDILSLSTLEMHGNAIEKTEFDLAEIARTGRRLLREQAAAKKLKLLPVAHNEPLYVLGDSQHTKKALLNIVTNSVKYTSQGQIEISVGLTEEGEAVLAVQDSGIGMNEDQLRQFTGGPSSYEEFYSLRQDGKGLGLPLTRLLVERQGARLEFESQKGPESGTIARIIFPKEVVTNAEGDFI